MLSVKINFKSFQQNNWELSGKKWLKTKCNNANGILKDKAGYIPS